MDRRKLHLSVAMTLLMLLSVTLAGVGAPKTLAQSSPAQTVACQELIVNGGFEDGHTGWTAYSKFSNNLLDPFYPHAGKIGAWLGAADNAEDWLTQTVTLPAGQDITLRYWWSIYSEEMPGAKFDVATSDLLRTDGAVLTTTLTLNNESAEAWLWNVAEADVSAYAGRTVQLRLRATTDSTNPSSFFFDDVSILACPSAGTPTVTPTPKSRLFLPLVLR